MFNFNHGDLGNTLGVNTGLAGLTGLTGLTGRTGVLQNAQLETVSS